MCSTARWPIRWLSGTARTCALGARSITASQPHSAVRACVLSSCASCLSLALSPLRMVEQASGAPMASPASPSSASAAAALAAAQLQEGLLSRLDDKLDELEAAHRLSRPQLQEEEYVPGAAVAAGAATAGRQRPRRGQPLASAVRDLTCQWSEGFLALAEGGDTACMFIVAQMHLAPKGYGSLAANRPTGIRWLMRAIDAGDIEARAYARKAAHKELMEHLARKQLKAEADAAAAAAAAAASAGSDSAASPASPSASSAAASGQSPHDPDESALRIAMEQMALRELDVAAEEQKQRLAREAEFGE